MPNLTMSSLRFLKKKKRPGRSSVFIVFVWCKEKTGLWKPKRFIIDLLMFFFYQRFPCKESLSTLTVNTKCPKDGESFEKRKMTLNCESVRQNCTKPANFQYHCLLNEYANQSVEVCAIATNIIGKIKSKYWKYWNEATNDNIHSVRAFHCHGKVIITYIELQNFYQKICST
jgi:hypothetical protein